MRKLLDPRRLTKVSVGHGSEVLNLTPLEADIMKRPDRLDGREPEVEPEDEDRDDPRMRRIRAWG